MYKNYSYNLFLNTQIISVFFIPIFVDNFANNVRLTLKKVGI